MSTELLPIIHPGEILQLDFLEPMNITPYRLSVDIGVAQTRISQCLLGVADDRYPLEISRIDQGTIDRTLRREALFGGHLD
jgi:hypothetical protein